MKNKISSLIILAVFTTIFNGCAGVAMADSQSEGVISQSEDLCGGTGGNGEIISVGSNAFTLKLDEDGQKDGDTLVVNLTDQATIETLTGLISLSDLKIGDRVTLVGDKNRDGSFTVDAVLVCSGTGAVDPEVNGENSKTSIAVRNKNPEVYEKASSIINAVTLLFVVLVWFGMVVFFISKRKKTLVYTLFFTVFYIYFYKVIDYTLLQFQSLLLLQYFVPDLMLNGFKDGTNVNLIPLATLRLEDTITSVLNIIMMMPFGFGLPFITNFRMKKVVLLGLFLSIAIEFLQFITGFLANTTFRVADVNDLLFNTVGVAIGYILFVGFVYSCRKVYRKSKISKNPIFRYIADRP